MAAPVDHVVAGHHPDPDVRRLGARHGGLGLVARRVDHPDQARHLQVDDVGEQVAVRVEAGRVDVAHGGGHHPLARRPPSAPCSRCARWLRSASHGTAPAVDSAGRGAVHHRRRRALDEAAHDRPARTVHRRVERRPSACTSGRTAGWPAGAAARGCRRCPARPCAPSTSSAPSVGSPTTLPSTSLASLATRYGRIASSIVADAPAAWWTCAVEPVARCRRSCSGRWGRPPRPRSSGSSSACRSCRS